MEDCNMCAGFAAFVIQCNRSTVQGEACWCIRCEFFDSLFFICFLLS